MYRSFHHRLLLLLTVAALAAVPVGAAAGGDDVPDGLHTIPFSSGTADPAADFPEALPADHDLVLVQWERFGDTAMVHRIAATGVVLVQPLAPVSYLVWADAAQTRALQGTDGVRFAGVLPPHARVADSVTAATTRLRVTFVGDRDRPVTRIAGGLTEALGLSRLPQVYSVADAGGRPELRDEKGAQIVARGTDNGAVQPGYHDFLAEVGADGSGVTVAVVDGGIDFTHPELTDREAGCVDYGFQQGIFREGSCSTRMNDDAVGHGTHVAGIVAGTGSTGLGDLDGFTYGLGVAPGAGLVSQNAISVHAIDEPFANGYRPVYRDAYELGAVVSQNAWGPSGSPQGYDEDTREFDEIVRDADDDTPGDQQIALIFSIMNGQGGTSTQGSPDEAKNILAVGATGTRGPTNPGLDDLCDCTAHGPALDGRILPDLVAPGQQVVSTRASIGTVCGMPFLGWFPWTPALETPPSPVHAPCTGTSMASPHASGAHAVFVDWYRQNVADDETATPSPALVKAAFINGADDLAGARDANGNPMTNIPNNQQGWGRLNLGSVIDAWDAAVYHDQDVAFTGSGQWGRTQVTVTDPSQPLKASLVWTDAPGPGTGGEVPALINDFDLEVVAPDGTTVYRGNVFSNGFSIAGGEPDRKNNVENVYLAEPQAGTYTVKVKAANIIGQASPSAGTATWQDFALVITNADRVPRDLDDPDHIYDLEHLRAQ